jgi:hypothetical protein
MIAPHGETNTSAGTMPALPPQFMQQPPGRRLMVFVIRVVLIFRGQQKAEQGNIEGDQPLPEFGPDIRQMVKGHTPKCAS